MYGNLGAATPAFAQSRGSRRATMGYLGRTIARQDLIPISVDGESVTGTWSSTPTTRRTPTRTTRRTERLPEQPVTRQPLPQDCPEGQAWSHRYNKCIPFGDPYASQRSACNQRAGYQWDDVGKRCISTDPYVEQKNRCAMTGGRWDSIRNTCQIGRTIIEPTGPSLPVKEPDISVLDQSKETNGAPPSMIDTDRASGGGSGIPQWADRQEQQPISISVTGGGGRGAPGAPGAAAPAPKWLVPAIIGASMFLL